MGRETREYVCTRVGNSTSGCRDRSYTVIVFSRGDKVTRRWCAFGCFFGFHTVYCYRNMDICNTTTTDIREVVRDVVSQHCGTNHGTTVVDLDNDIVDYVVELIRSEEYDCGDGMLELCGGLLKDLVEVDECRVEGLVEVVVEVVKEFDAEVEKGEYVCNGVVVESEDVCDGVVVDCVSPGEGAGQEKEEEKEEEELMVLLESLLCIQEDGSGRESRREYLYNEYLIHGRDIDETANALLSKSSVEIENGIAACARRRDGGGSDGLDGGLKASIVSKYHLQAVSPGDSGALKSKKKKKERDEYMASVFCGGKEASSKGKVRFRDGAIVSTKGEKYIVEKTKEEWDGGSRGRVKSKGKRGVGWV